MRRPAAAAAVFVLAASASTSISSRGYHKPNFVQSQPSAATTSSAYSLSSQRQQQAHAPKANPRNSQSDDESFGIFQHTHINAFPIRAAIDIGTGGMMSLCVGRVDAEKSAITKLMYSTQLPLYLEASQPMSSSSSFSRSAFALSERTVTDVRNKMRVLTGAMRRDAFEGLSERAAVLSHPLCLAENAEQLAADLTREFKIDVRVLGRTFHVEWPGLEDETSPPMNPNGDDEKDRCIPQQHHRSCPSSHKSIASPKKTKMKKRGSLTRLLAQNKQLQRGTESKTSTPPHKSTNAESSSPSSSTEEQLRQLAFLAHAAAAQCVAPQRLLTIVEDPQKGLSIVGADTSAHVDVRDLLSDTRGLEVAGLNSRNNNHNAVDEEEHRRRILEKAGLASTDFSPPSVMKRNNAFTDGRGGDRADATQPVSTSTNNKTGTHIVEHRLPFDAAEVHRTCILDIQRRPPESYGLQSSSPNPLLKEEWIRLRDLCIDRMKPTLPEWVIRKAALGGVIAGTSFNGGVLNIAARVAQRTPIALEHLEVNAQFHFCGLTDTLLAASFPNPLLVLTNAALAAALFRVLRTPRVSYLPELSVAAALLVQPSLWLQGRARQVKRALKRDSFYTDVRQRTYARPHVKQNPTAAPQAEGLLNGTWNDTSYEKSLRGT